MHEIWTWQGDTSVLPHKVTEILNQVSVFDENDPKHKSDDPFDFERPYKSDFIKARLKSLMSDNRFCPEGFFFITSRSQAVGCCMVLIDLNTGRPNCYKLEYLATIPSAQGNGVEEALVQLALKYCLITSQKGVQVDSEPEISCAISEEYIRDH